MFVLHSQEEQLAHLVLPVNGRRLRISSRQEGGVRVEDYGPVGGRGKRRENVLMRLRRLRFEAFLNQRRA